MATRTDFPEFRCDDCGSVSIVIEGPLTDTAPVKCCGCDADLGPWDLFLDDLQWRLAEHGIPHLWHDPRKRTRARN